MNILKKSLVRIASHLFPDQITAFAYNYLTNPKKLLDYQAQYFENELSKIEIKQIKELIINDEKILIRDFKTFSNE